MWEYDWTWISKTQIKRVRKGHRDEFEACLANLDTVRKYLEMGLRIGAGLKFGFFRSEGGGLYRVGQSGVPDPKETRVYLYFEETSRVIYLVGMGFKEGQKTDINAARKIIKKIRQDR
jgi:hypothetical protein